MASGRRRSGRILIILAIMLVFILVLAGVLLRKQLLGRQTQTELTPTIQPRETLVKIVILAQPIQRDTPLTADVLTTISYPQSEMVDGLFYTDVNSVVGLRSKIDLPQGTPLISTLLTDIPVGSTSAVQIPSGMVAIALPLTKFSSVAYGLHSGDHVNILGAFLITDMDADFQTHLPNFTASVLAPGSTTKISTENTIGESTTETIIVTSGGEVSAQGRTELDPSLNQAVYVIPSEKQRPRLVTQTLVQDALVLWVGEFEGSAKEKTQTSAAPTPTAESNQAAQPEKQETNEPNIITVVVTPQDAVTLYWLMESGAKINLAMRSAGDHQEILTEAATTQFIMDQYAIPYPAKLPYGFEPRTDALSPSVSP